MDVNSEKYWDKRFDTNWESSGGRNQTQYFTELAIKLLPRPILNLFDENLTFLDWGCAEGDGANMISNRFPSLDVSGLDFSTSAIQKAREHFPKISFYTGSLKEYEHKYDIIYTSNCLEHYTDPFEWISQLMEYTQKMVIIMVPFQEYKRINEHFYTFDYKTFPLELNSFVMTYYKVIDSNPDYWPGKQLLIIYSKQTAGVVNNLSLDVYNPKEGLDLNEQDSYIDKLKEQIKQRDDICNHVSSENKTLSEWLSVLQDEVKKRDESVANLRIELQEKDKWIKSLNEEVKKRDDATHYLITEIEEKNKWIAALQEEVEKRDQSVDELLKQVNSKSKC